MDRPDLFHGTDVLSGFECHTIFPRLGCPHRCSDNGAADLDVASATPSQAATISFVATDTLRVLVDVLGVAHLLDGLLRDWLGGIAVLH